MSETESNAEISFDTNSESKRRKRRKNIVDEEALETIVFGKETNVLENINKKVKTKVIDEEFGIIEDRDGRQQMPNLSQLPESEDDSDSSEDLNYIKRDFFPELKQEVFPLEEGEEESKKKGVWSDADDDIGVRNALNSRVLPKRVDKDDNYRQYLENRFTDLYKTPKWAQIDDKQNKEVSDSDSSEDSEDSDEDNDRTAKRFRLKSNKLEKGLLPIKKCTHLTNDNKIKSPLNCVEFHPTSTVALVSSANGTVRLFQVDGKINARIQTIKFQDFKIETAKFSKSGEELIVGSKKDSGFYFYYDMIAGKIVKIPFIKGKERFCLDKFVLSNDQKYIATKGNNGFIHFLTTKSKEHIFDLKMNGEVMSLAFSEDSNYLLSHGNGGKAYVWDIRKRQCINRFTDEGCVAGTSIVISPDSRYCCTGSDMGVVNIYQFNDILTKTQPKPIKSLMNLTTEISDLKFNHSSELLMMLSNAKDNSIRCVHMNSLTVYSNFPKPNKNFGRIYDSDISLNSGYLSFATNSGIANLFRITNYSDY